ncbi:SIP domain-containing protein [Agromyces sp. ZXT2-3]|uniref:SIP domain-containing protein n=1 Tax=Agromyces sp. ZXT2-3 TaxID=3461152 RepID=UPI004054C3A4
MAPASGPGSAGWCNLRDLPRPEASVTAFAAGESKLATGARRRLVNEWGVPKADVTFCGYWRAW